ncbi:unnamed protein product, partial [Mesorhabditis belari]|uniref:Nerve growth factor-related domain-containing protein n=1 Tax=Mesorhabditis belari TaxID=2138241 RepID=A0AAF3EW55_9BILA
MDFRRSILDFRSITYLMLFFFEVFGLTASMVVFVKKEDLPFDLDRPVLRARRNARLTSALSETFDACPMRILPDHRPKFGHIHNGSRVEIQQDDEAPFSATFVECLSEVRESCAGVDNRRFVSECVTVYDHRPAGIRLVGSDRPFHIGSIRIPIACSCQLRKILHPLNYHNVDEK